MERKVILGTGTVTVESDEEQDVQEQEDGRGDEVSGFS